MSSWPCRECGQFENGQFHDLEIRLRTARYRLGELKRFATFEAADQALLEVMYLERQAKLQGYDGHPYLPMTNLEYLEFQADKC